MNWNLIITDDCNLCCTYCRGKMYGTCRSTDPGIAIDDTPPPDLSVDPAILYSFLARDPEATLTFYGGEPLLRSDLVEMIITEAPVKRFLLHTNGICLPSLDPALVQRFETIFVSIDGPEALTDLYRGPGTFRRAMDGVRYAEDAGFTGELIARMTVAEATDIEAAVRYLAGNESCPFSSIHWQMDANFWDDFGLRSFAPWVHNSYNPGIRRLVRAWLDIMRSEGRVPKWYPFLVTAEDLLLGKQSPLRCGSGHANYTIMTDGTIIPCPCMIGMRDYYLGHIATADPRGLPTVPVEGDCTICSLFEFCGGRCLYSNILRPWPDEGRKLVRCTVENLQGAINGVLPEIRALISEGRIASADFHHEKYQGCEVIP
ncbi:MAG: radical SAM/SPASM domain-containing protein [Methanoculleus sp. SDB]|nr:MAG: radical SAM/SPASM domain-containing protein [Methanoculleus sp. SDB]